MSNKKIQKMSKAIKFHLNILDYLNQEIQEVKNFIIERAQGKNFSQDTMKFIFEIDRPSSTNEDFEKYSIEELELHEFDLGMLTAYKNVLKKFDEIL